MTSVARGVDRVIGGLSRLLHVRAARHDTAGDLGPYLDVPADVLFPAPAAPRDVERERARLPRSGGKVVETLRWPSAHVPLCPRYRLRHEGEYALNQTAVARFIHPRSGPRRRALVYVHGWLEPGPWVEEALLLPKLYDALEVDVLHVQLPFHGSRNPPGSLFHGELFWTADLVRSMEAVRQSCIDARSLVAWLRAEGYEEVGVTGISLGGSITMVLACLRDPPDYIVPIVSHLYLAEVVEEAGIMWRMKSDLERFGLDREKRAEIFRRIGLERLRPVLPASRQQWIMARHDAYIDAALVERQWRQWGEPPIEWLPNGHMTFPLSLGKIVEAARVFHAGLGRPASAHQPA